jgi:hypothetical protein
VSDVCDYSGSHSESSGIGASLANHREQQHHDEVTLSAVTIDQLQQQNNSNSPQHSGISSMHSDLDILSKATPMHAQCDKHSLC